MFCFDFYQPKPGFQFLLERGEFIYEKQYSRAIAHKSWWRDASLALWVFRQINKYSIHLYLSKAKTTYFSCFVIAMRTFAKISYSNSMQ